jgi:hypothetical protein
VRRAPLGDYLIRETHVIAGAKISDVVSECLLLPDLRPTIDHGSRQLSSYG